ncbi:DUF4153 domain-containing protein [Aureimonas mangrovi]|uniref:DUF4153 domain-containing protein n=1 Tax=Aureimonas mangrovi TaxID=2758041 RepID=UPI00163D3E0F|nr:DUF4153 domain-containing protein [Aureimonas mangrovi]
MMGLAGPFRRSAAVLRGLGTGAFLATMRFPLAAVLILLFSVLANLEVARLDVGLDLTRLLSAIAVAGAASVAARAGLEPLLTARPFALAALPVMVGLSLALLVWFGRPLLLFAPALICASILCVPLAPFLRHGSSGAFWWHSLWTIVGVTLAFFSILLFVAGFFAILEMVRFLFDVGLSNRAYEHILVTSFTLVGPLFALGRVPARDTSPEAGPLGEEKLVTVVRPLFDWVAAPLALVTALVLHLYAGRILLTGEVPAGEIGWIVSFFSLLVLGVRIAIDPFLERGALPARLFGRLWAAMLVVPLALLAYALWLRIGGEGVTAPRYFLALTGSGVAGAVILQAFGPTRGDIRWIYAVAPLLLALSVAGPWSVGNIVGRSQIALIESRFVEGGRLRLEGLERREPLELRSRISALGDVGQLSRLEPFIPPERAEALAAATRSGEAGTRAVLAALGLSFSAPGVAETRGISTFGARPLPLAGYDLAVTGLYAHPLDTTGNRAVDAQELAAWLDGQGLVVRFRAIDDRFDLAQTIAALPEDLFGTDPVDAPVLDLVSRGGRSARLRVESLTLDRTDAPIGLGFTILLRASQWPSGGSGG